MIFGLLQVLFMIGPALSLFCSDEYKVSSKLCTT